MLLCKLVPESGVPVTAICYRLLPRHAYVASSRRVQFIPKRSQYNCFVLKTSPLVPLECLLCRFKTAGANATPHWCFQLVPPLKRRGFWICVEKRSVCTSALLLFRLIEAVKLFPGTAGWNELKKASEKEKKNIIRNKSGISLGNWEDIKESNPTIRWQKLQSCSTLVSRELYVWSIYIVEERLIL